MKRIQRVFIVFLCAAILSVGLPTFASAMQTKIYGEHVTAKAGKVSFDIAVQGNTGIMGFRISLSYDRDVFSSPTVKKGTLPNSGSFETSAGIGKEGSFDVIYAGTKAITSDGTLFSVTMDYTADKIASGTISVSYSQSDTFDGQYEDVSFLCEPVTVNFPSDEVKTEVAQTSKSDAAVIQNYDQDMLSVVQDALDSFGARKIEDVPQEQQKEFMAHVKENSAYVLSFETIEQVEDGFSLSVQNDIQDSLSAKDNEADFDSVVRKALDGFGVKKVEDIPSEKRQDFIQAILEGVADFDEALADEFVRLDDEDIMETIRANYSGSAPVEYPEKSFAQRISDGIYEHKAIVISAAGIVVLIVTVLALYIQKTKRRKEK